MHGGFTLQLTPGVGRDMDVVGHDMKNDKAGLTCTHPVEKYCAYSVPYVKNDSVHDHGKHANAKSPGFRF